MSNPYGPKIETTEDWNDALACCCQMSEPPEPTLIAENHSANARARDTDYTDAVYARTRRKDKHDYWVAQGSLGPEPPAEGAAPTPPPNYNPQGSGGYYSNIEEDASDLKFHFEFPPHLRPAGVDADELPVIYRTEEVDQTEEWTYTMDETYFEYFFYAWFVGWDEGYPTITDTRSATTFTRVYVLHHSATEDPATEQYTNTTTTTSSLSDPVSKADVIARCITRLGSRWDPPASSYYAVATTTATWPLIGATWPHPPVTTYVTTSKVRYRWRVPSTWFDPVAGAVVAFTGTYFKITWDVLYEPVGWDDEDIPEEARPIRFSRKNLTVEWEGPGTGAQSDPSWLAGDWYELAAPEEVGVRKVINIRFEHLRKETP